MKNLGKILLEALISFLIGAAVLFFVLVCYGVRYMFKSGAGKFAFAVNGMGVAVSEWTILSMDQIIFICVIGGLIMLIIDLVWTIVRLLRGQN